MGYFTELAQPSKKEDDAELPKAAEEMVGPITVADVFPASKQPTLPSALKVPYTWLFKKKKSFLNSVLFGF